jgi:phosphomannomutase
MEIDSSIFKAYDIRGVYPEQLTEQGAYAIARAYASLMQRENPGKQLTIVVGGDMRVSTPALKAEVIRGLTDSGLNVVDAGLLSTPTYYFAVAYYGYEGGIQVSASHNPKQWNGLKIVRKGAAPVGGSSGMQTIKQMVIDDSFPPLAETKGMVTSKNNVTEEEAQVQLGTIDKSKIKPFKIVIDAANAMGAIDMQAAFKLLPGQIVPMNFELDGTFPAHEADPLKPENLKDLEQRVLAEQADLGIATDGDGDRIFFVDNKGRAIPQSIVRGLLAQIELEQSPGAKIVYDIRPGRVTVDMIEEAGGQPVVAPVGSVLIKEVMDREQAIFGGESSGHFFYRLPYGTFEAPMLVAAKFLTYVSEKNQPLSDIVDHYNRYFHSGEINQKVESRQQVDRVIEKIKTASQDGQMSTLDGLTVEYPDVWFNVRASNTEPLIRLAIEGRTQAAMAAKRDQLMELMG